MTDDTPTTAMAAFDWLAGGDGLLRLSPLNRRNPHSLLQHYFDRKLIPLRPYGTPSTYLKRVRSV